MKLLLLPFAIAAIVVGAVALGLVLGLLGMFTGLVVGVGAGLGGAVVGVTVGLLRLAGHMAAPLLVVLGILLLVKIADRV